MIPDAPRIAEQGFPSNFSWDILPAKFYEAPLKVAHSELNLSSNPEPDSDVVVGNGMKSSKSAFEILSLSDNMMNNVETEEEVRVEEEKIKKVVSKTVERPKTFE